MKIILVGANGTIGKNIDQAFQGTDHQIVRVGKSRGDFQVDIEDPKSVAQLYSPTVLKESLDKYAGFFQGFPAVDGYSVGQAFKKSILGIQTGQIYKLYQQNSKSAKVLTALSCFES